MPTFREVTTRPQDRPAAGPSSGDESPTSLPLLLSDRTEVVVDLVTGGLVVRQWDGTGRRGPGREYRHRNPGGDGLGPGWSLLAAPDGSVDRDAAGRIVRLAQPSGAWSEHSYDAAGLLIRSALAGGLITDFGWAAGRWLTAVTVAGAAGIDVDLDESGSVLAARVTGPDGIRRLRFAYATGRTTVVGPTGLRTVHEFDDEGRPVAVTDHRGRVTRHLRDGDASLVTVAGPGSGVLSRRYDAAGRFCALRLPTSAESLAARYSDRAAPGSVTVLRDPAGAELHLHHDDAGRLVRARAPGGHADLESREYDPVHGGIVTRTDGNGAVTAYRYDADGALSAVIPPAPLGPVRYHRDRYARIIGITDGNGRRIGHRYEEAGRPAELTDERTGRSLISLRYDALGRVTRKSGPGWSYEFDWTYTPAGSRLIAARRSSDGTPEEIRARYGGTGALESFATPGGTSGYDWTPAGDLASVTTPAGRTARFTHDVAGRLTGVDFGPGTAEIGYDDSGRRTALTVRDGAGTVVLAVAYGYTLDDGTDTDVLRWTVVDGERVTYRYDGLKRLAAAGETTYDYDGANHLVRLGGTTFGLNGAGQVIRFGETAFAYDGAGNFTEETNPTGSFTYSPTQQTLTGVFGGVRVVDIDYDGLGQETPRRITETTVDGRTVTHLLTHSPLGVVRAADDGVPTDFVRTPDGALLAVLTADGRHYWAVTDQQGSVLALLDEQGGLAARYRYTPHGAVTASGPAAAVNPFRYRGAYQLLRSAHVLEHRLYNGFWGRFTQPDPTGRQYAPYTFAGNDPLNTGTWTRHDFWSVLARPGESPNAVFFPAVSAGAVDDFFTGPGPIPGEPPLTAGPRPSRIHP